MIIKSITQVGNPIIRRKSKKVVSMESPETKKVVKDLVDSMRSANLVGMAAPQIGHNLRIFVTEIRTTPTRKTAEPGKLLLFINPEITNFSQKQALGYEGCGSVASANIFGKVLRSSQITIEAFDKNNKKFTLTAKGLLARVIQHEFDHLEGIIFLDKVSDKKSLMSREEYIKRC
ncbi:MAG: peptide deformylase [Candidatus Moraniibacteriota bacterium]